MKRGGFAQVLGLVLGLSWLAPPAMALDWPWQARADEANPAPRPVVSVIVEPASRYQRSVPGAIAARTQVNLGFQTLGRVVMRDVDTGERVQQGQVLARLDPEDLTGQVRAAQAAVQAAQVQLDTAIATEDRVRRLAARNVASTAQLEQAQQALAAAQSAASQAQSELLRAQDAAGFATITAPFDGVISAVFESPGAVVQAGAPVVQLSAEDQAEAVIDLPETTLAQLPDDPPLTVWDAMNPAGATSARIDRIEPLADSATRTRRVHLRLDDATGFRLGALIRVRIDEGHAQVLALPQAALWMRDDLAHVWRVTRGDQGASVAAVAVSTGAALGDQVAITGGLVAGDEVVIRGVHSLAEGQPVGRRISP